MSKSRVVNFRGLLAARQFVRKVVTEIFNQSISDDEVDAIARKIITALPKDFQ